MSGSGAFHAPYPGKQPGTPMRAPPSQESGQGEFRGGVPGTAYATTASCVLCMMAPELALSPELARTCRPTGHANATLPREAANW